MEQIDQRDREIAGLRERLLRLSEASLRINEDLDFNTVLQGVLDSARSLTGARYAAITLSDDLVSVQDYLFSGMTEQQARQFLEVPGGNSIPEILQRTPATSARS